MGEISLGCCGSGLHPGAPLHIPEDAGLLQGDVFAYFLHEQILVAGSTTSSAHNVGMQGVVPQPCLQFSLPLGKPQHGSFPVPMAGERYSAV